MKRRALSFIVVLALCLNLFPVEAFAADVGTVDGLCPHHQAHTDTCGYVPPVLGQECTHSHNDGCYTTETNCIHAHTAECYSDSGDVSGAEGPTLCAHTCTLDSGCVTRTLSCPHEHDDTCGYVAGGPGAPCTFACSICPIEALISELPSSVSARNAEQVQAQLSEIYALYDELTVDEQQQVDLSPCAVLLEQMDGMGAAALSGSSDSAPGDFTLSKDTVHPSSLLAEIPITLNTNGYTLTIQNGNAIQVTGTGVLDIIGGGLVISNNGSGVEVQPGGFLSIAVPGTSIQGEIYGLDIASGATVRLSAGTYFGYYGAIHTADGDFSALLEPGCAYFDENGKAILPANIAMKNPQTLSVSQCSGHVKTYAPNTGAPAHTWTCDYCGMGETEKCTFTFDEDGNGTCAFCGNEITVEVDQDSLKELAYDDTVKPANGTVTVRVKGAATALMEDTDYTVLYSTRAEVGSTAITVTVQVDGVAYNGTFTQDYTFTEADLNEPVLQWNTTDDVSVPYTGSPVPKGQLPDVTIHIAASPGVDLHDRLQYSYRTQGNNTAYTVGLPTNAGTYEIVVSLPEGPDYQAASSEPITLIINPIDPMGTAPAATRPTYNRTAQELVTPGALDPAAVGDGLKIEFATNEAGPYSTAIPTGTDAGDHYRVWYKVVGLTGNYIAPNPNPAEVTGVEILPKQITPVVELSQSKYQYDGEWKEPGVTVKDNDDKTVLQNDEYQVSYKDNRNVGQATVEVADRPGGNYAINTVEVHFEITSRAQNALSITNQPNTVTYGNQFTLGTSGGSGNGLVTWKITAGADVAEVDPKSGQVTVIGDGSATIQATKSGKDPGTSVINYEDATATWTLTAEKKPVTATVTAEDKPYNGDNIATIHAVVESGVLPGDEITITGLTGTFDNGNAGPNKTVTVKVDTNGQPVDMNGQPVTITGKNSEHYDISYSSLTVKAAIHKAIAKITTAPTTASLTYNGTAQALIAAGAVVDPADVLVEYALSETGPYSTTFPTGTNAGTYTVWYRVQETPNYTGLDPAHIDVTIAKKQAAPTITLDQDTFVYDGTPKEPVVTLIEADGTTIILASEYTVAYSGNVNVGAATVTVTAKADGNYSFTAVTKNFTITKEQAKVISAPKPAGKPLVFDNMNLDLVTEGTGSGGTMVYCVDDEDGNYLPTIPTRFNAAEYKVYYKVKGDANHSDSAVGQVSVTIAPKRVDNPTIELQNDDGTAFVSCIYDGSAKEPKVVVKDGSTVIDAGEYNIIYGDNIDAGKGTVNITAKPGKNYTVTGSTTFVIEKANIVFNSVPSAANITYDGKAHELLVPGTTTGGTVQYALNSATSTFTDAIPTGINAGSYTVYYKVVGDKNHNDFSTASVSVTIQRKPLTDITIELTPNSFEYDGTVKMPAVTVKFKEGRTETVVPETEYDWACDNSAPTNQGTYTITISDAQGGNYDLDTAASKTATFSIGKTAQAPLSIENKPAATIYGDTFTLTTSGGSGTGAVTWSATGPATVDGSGNVTINGVGEVTVTAEKVADTNYLSAQDQWTFTAAPKPVTASVTVSSKPYDGDTSATVASANIDTADLVTGDTVTIDPTSITAAFGDPHAGTDKTVTLDTSKVQVTGNDAAKYAISYPDTVKADIAKATTTITTNPEKVDPLTYNGQPQALVTGGQTNVGFLVYSLDGNSFSSEIPTGTNAGIYTVYYKVDETDDYTGIAANGTPISATIGPKSIIPVVELSESSFLYDGTKKNPKVTVKDGNTVIDTDQYTVTWANDDSSVTDGLLTAAGTYTATIKNEANGNYSFTAEAHVEITKAPQAALKITGKPEHVYYGDTVTTLDTTGGTGEGTVKWSVASNGNNATIEESTGKLTITGVGSVTVRAERSVPNYGTVGDNWNFTVEPKPVVAEVTITAKDYDGTADIAETAITAQVKDADLVGSDTVALTGLKGSYTDANAGTGKTVTLDSNNATKADDDSKYTVTYPVTAKGDINPRQVTVAVTLSGNDLQQDANGYFYTFDGTAKTPAVTVTAGDDNAVLAVSDYSVSYAGNKNVGDATVTVMAKAGGNYTFGDVEVKFAIKSAGAVLISSPQAKDLTYEKGTEQELVTVGAATGGTVVYSLTNVEADYSEDIPKKAAAGTYTVYYMVKGDANHANTAPGQVSATIKPKEITPAITLSGDGLTDTNGIYSYEYDGTAKTPTVTVKDGSDEVSNTEYSVSYRDNVNAGTATVTVSDANAGNYTVNGSVTFEITKAAPNVTTGPAGKTDLQYNGELQELVSAGVSSEGTVVYSVNGGNYSSAIPTASAVDTYTIDWKVLGDANHSDTIPVTLNVEIAKNTVTKPTISLSSDQFQYSGGQQKPTITVYDDNSRVIPEHEYTTTITGEKSGNMVDVDTYTIKITTPDTSNYVIADDGTGNNTRTFEILAADQEAISITGTQARVTYGDTIQLGVSGGTGSGTTTWEVKANGGSTISPTGLLTVKDVGGPITVMVTRSKNNYGDVSATWEFTAGKKPVTAVVTANDRNFSDSDRSATVTASVPNSELVSGDSITITGLTGEFDDPNVGTDKKVTVNSSQPNVTGTNWEKYDITYPATTTASILGVAATVNTEPTANTLTYDASQAQALVTAGTATGGAMVYSLDGVNFTPSIPKGKDAGTYTVYYKAQGDGNHTDSAVGSKDVTIAQQTVEAADLQIELSPPSGQYDGKVQQPAVTVRDSANNVIPTSEYTVVYDAATNWKGVGKHKVKVQNITGGNYVIADGAVAEFEISTTAQAPLEIVNKPGLVYYGDTFTLSATGGSGSDAVTWSVDDTSVVEIDANGFVKIIGVGQATITATKTGGGNYDTATATYPLNALKKPITAIVTAEDRVYASGNTSATIHVDWKGGDLVGNDTINTAALTGRFADDKVGANKTVTIEGGPINDSKYDITIPATTTASILKADTNPPAVTANTLEYSGSAQALVSAGNANTRYSDARDGVYSAAVPTGTNAGTYIVWYKDLGDPNHNDSAPQAATVTISQKKLTTMSITLSGNDLKDDGSGNYSYAYDGTEKTPTVTIKDGSAVIPASEYTVTYRDNKNVGNATVTITSSAGGNYTFDEQTVNFEITSATAQLTSSPQAKDLTYTGQAQELVTVGAATGGHLEYRLHSDTSTDADYSTDIPTAAGAGTYTVDYRVMGDANHTDGPAGSVTVIIKPKTVISPKITVDGTYIYDGTAKEPGTAVKVEDGTTTIPASEYTLSYRDNINVGTATVIVTDNNGGNYTVNGTATFQIAKTAATVGAAPTGKTGLHYNGTAQELLDTKGTATGGTLVYALALDGEYSAAIPTGKDVGEYEIWYMVQGDSNHTDTEPQSVTASIIVNSVTAPTIQVTPATVKYTGEKQTPTVTVRDDNGLLIDGSEYTATYLDENSNDDLIQVGTYTVTVTEVTDGNYTFDTTDGKNTATFTITPADQTPLTITGTRERVYYGDTIPLGTTGSSGGTVAWKVDNSSAANIGKDTGLLKITGVGSVTVTATSTKPGYAEQTATWTLYAEKKPVTAVVTAEDRAYTGDKTATLSVTWKAGDLAEGDSINTMGLTGEFTDANVGANKTVKITGTLTHANYDITVPPTTTASIFKADIAAADVTVPTSATGLKYTGLPLELITTAGTATGGTMEYSTDGINYSASLPAGTDAGNYDVWYRVKGDGNHNDTAGTKLGNQVTIAPQEVANPTIEFNPSGATYDGQEHKPTVKVLDAHGRVIPDSEYTVAYGSTNWKDVGDHTVTVTGKADGNYSITGTPAKTFTILPAGQSPLSIVGQPGEVQYGGVFTLSTNGGSGTGAVTWETSDDQIAYVNSQTGRVEIMKAGGPVTITARKAAGGGYGETTATWTFSAEKRPATAIVTARNKPYDSTTTAALDISWKDGDLLSGDTITLNLTGAFDDANVGENKIVRITRSGDLPDGGGKYAVTYNNTTTASITAQAATVSGVQSGPWTYSGSEQSLLSGGTATNGTIVYSRNGVDFMETAPTETNAGKYTVYYKARGNTNYADSDVRMVEVTIQPKTVSSPAIELSQETFTYDGTAKEPDVVAVKDGSSVIPPGEYTVSYSNNVNVGTTARVTITDAAGGNYTVTGSRNFTITAGAVSLTNPPQANDLTYNGFDQALVKSGTAVNGSVVYSTNQSGTYTDTIPTGTNAGFYQVWYKAKGNGGETAPESMIVEIKPRPVTPILTLSSNSLTYTGSALMPTVTVSVNNQPLTQGTDYTVVCSNNTEPGTATVTVTSIGGNYQFSAQTTFTITKSKAVFALEPKAKENLVYNGGPQELVSRGYSADGIVLYSTNATTYSSEIPTGTAVRDDYVVFAKVQGNSTHEDSDVVIITVEIGINEVKNPTVELSATSFPYTGSVQKPTITVSDDDGNVIATSEYRVTYTGDTINPGKYTLTITSRGKNYSFADIEREITITDATQTPLAITGKQDAVCYGDTLNLGTTGGGSGTVTWNATGPVDKLGDGQYKVNSSGSVTITATKGSNTDTWTFYAQPKPVTAVVIAADKVYDGNNTANLTVTLSGLIPGDSVSLTANGSFIDEKAGTNKNVLITGLNGLDGIKDKYTVTYNSTTTASITPKPAAVLDTDKPKLAGSLTYNGDAQALLTNGGTADSGNLMYSLDGQNYSYTIPTGTDAKTYTVWYKVQASDDNHKDSAAVKLGDVTIAANVDAPTILCTPSTIQYDGTEKTPDVVVRDSANHIIPASEYTVTLPAPRIAVGKYAVTVTDKPGGNYEFTSPVTVADAFEIVAASQNPLSIVTDIPTDVHYGDTFRLSAMGGSGSGAIQWSIAESNVATINANGVVTVKGIGGFTVKAYRAASDGYSQSNTDSVPFDAKPKPVTPVVTASDKSYDGKTDATLTASWKSGDLVSGDTITITATGAFATADAGTNKQVNITGHTATGTNADKYAITWPDSATASIYKVDAKLAAAPVGKTLNYTGSELELVSAGTTVNGIGTIMYSLNDQNGTYSSEIPKATDVGTYTVWYKVADSVNYTGIPAASVKAEIKASGSVANTPTEDTENTSLAPPTEDTNNTPTLPVSTPLQTTVRDGTANTVLSASGGNQLVKEAVKNQSDTIVIKPEITSDVTKTQVSIPASTVSQIQNETNAALTVSTPIADATIPREALNTLSQAGGTVNVVTEQVGDAVALTLTADGKTVENVPGGVTLTVPAEGAGPGTVAVLVQEDGSREIVQRSVVKDGKLSAPLSGSATVEIVDNSKAFADVQPTDWAAEAVTFASARGLFSGTSETTFSPEETTSRSMVATVLYRLEGQPDQALASAYNDVSDDAWYADSVAWAAENGIVNGYGDGKFGPNDSVTREQFVVMLWRYVGSPEANDRDLAAFTDADQINSYALEALCWAVENGVLNGNGNGKLVPGGTATRAEAAQMLKNFIENT